MRTMWVVSNLFYQPATDATHSIVLAAHTHAHTLHTWFAYFNSLCHLYLHECVLHGQCAPYIEHCWQINGWRTCDAHIVHAFGFGHTTNIHKCARSIDRASERPADRPNDPTNERTNEWIKTSVFYALCAMHFMHNEFTMQKLHRRFIDSFVY